jgi:hypothetical protein
VSPDTVMRQLLRRIWYVIRQRQLESDLAVDFHCDMKERKPAPTESTVLRLNSWPLVENSGTPRSRENRLGRWIAPWLEGLCAPGWRQGVVTCAPVVLGRTPLGSDPPFQEEPLQRRVQRTLAHLQHSVRHVTVESVRRGRKTGTH